MSHLMNRQGCPREYAYPFNFHFPPPIIRFPSPSLVGEDGRKPDEGKRLPATFYKSLLMKWNQVFGGVFIGLGLGLFLGGAIVDLTGKWNSTSSAGVGGLLAVSGVIAIQRARIQKPREKHGPDQ
jgi:hypothetical protein